MNPAEPLLGAARAQHLQQIRSQQGERPTADDTLLRGSDAYGCARKIALGALRIPKDITYTNEQLLAFRAGDDHHKHLQAILAADFDAELEVPISYKTLGIEVSGHADAFYTHDRQRRVVEIKTMKQYPFDKAIGGEGPRLGDLLQGGIYANSPQLQADAVHICYLNKQDGALAEWIIGLGDQVGPEDEKLIELVREELERLQQIADDIHAGLLPWRRIPGFGVVKDPTGPKGENHDWRCDYCSWQPTCARLPVSKVPIARLADDAPQTDTEDVVDAEVVG